MDEAATGVAERHSAEAELSEVRPRLRHDVVFAEADGGVFLRHAGNGFLLKGRSAYRLVSSLSPHLTGEHTVGELCAGLGSVQATMVRSTVRTLLDRGFVRDRRVPDPDTVPAPPVLARFSRQIAFIEHYADDAAERFTTFRASRILVAGSGPVVDAAVLGVIRNGVHRVHLTSDAAPQARLEAQALTAAGAPIEIVPVIEPDLAEFDAVVCGDSIGPDALAALVRRTIAGVGPGPTVLPVAVVGDRAVLGPVTRAGTAPCWYCAMLRVCAASPVHAADLWRRVTLGPLPAAQPLTGPVAALIGNALAFEVFRLRTGCMPAETDRAVITCDLNTLEAHRGLLSRHPLCPACPAPPPHAAPALSPADLDACPAAAEHGPVDPFRALLDDGVGVLSRYTDGPLPQSPVRVGRVRLPDPTGAGGAPADIVGFDLDTTMDARTRAVMNAAARYADTIALRSGLLTGSREDLTAAGHDPVDPADLSTWLGMPAAVQRWVPAVVLGTDRRCHVPADAAFPVAQPIDSPLFEPGPVGGGCGRDDVTAVRDALLSALAYRALRSAADGDLVTEVTVDNDDVRLLTRAAELLSRRVRIFDLSTDGCGHVVLALADDGTGRVPAWRVGAARTLQEAAVSAVRDLVGTIRLAVDGIDADLGTTVLPDFDPRTLRVRSGSPDAEPRTADTGGPLVECLRANGLTALVVDTTTPDLRDAGLTTVRVLLRRTPGEPGRQARTDSEGR